MKRQSTEVVCDECREHSPLEAVIACEVHSVDLCEIHLRKHFNRQVCRLVPVEREPDEWERLIERLPTKRKN
jgi:hypothetical protein